MAMASQATQDETKVSRLPHFKWAICLDNILLSNSFNVIQREPGQPVASKFTPGVPDANPTTQMEIKKENVSNKDSSRDYYFPEADF